MILFPNQCWKGLITAKNVNDFLQNSYIINTDKVSTHCSVTNWVNTTWLENDQLVFLKHWSTDEDIIEGMNDLLCWTLFSFGGGHTGFWSLVRWFSSPKFRTFWNWRKVWYYFKYFLPIFEIFRINALTQ